MKAHVASVGMYVPQRRMSNSELTELVDTSDEWIYSHTGIRCRHIADDSEAASDLAYHASIQALEQASLEPAQIDLVLLATSTPDYPGLPSTASIVQDRIGAKKAGAMDIAAACTGFVYGVETARAFVSSGAARTVLVIGSEVYSRILNWRDRDTCVLFGDGAGAVIVKRSDEEAGQSEVLDSFLRSRGSGARTLLRPTGGSRTPFVPGETEIESTRLSMDGRRVYMFAVGALTDVVNYLLERNNLTIDQIDHIVPHQANIRIIDAACKRGRFPPEKFFTNLEEYANTSAASIPIALHEMVEKGRLQRGDMVITVGFGAGLTYGGNLIRW
ncbi:MAG: ketoacyl-ACP synthase III [Spirochaetales bacterium]|nr:ketoacyl-ACP synthase III [Spirochaetales bacterium]